MPANARTRGDDVEVRWTKDGVEVEGVANVESLSMTILIETMTAEFLGQDGVTVDDQAKGAEGTLTLQWGTPEAFEFVKAILDRVQKRTPGVIFNMGATVQMPDGSARMVLFGDVAFGNIPINFQSRGAHGTIQISWKVGQPPSFVEA